MTRRKKSKSATTGNGASSVPAPVQVAPVAAGLQGGAGEPDVTYTIPTCPRTGYSLLGPRPVYPILAPRAVQSSPVTQPASLAMGPRQVYAPRGPRPVHSGSVPHPVPAFRPTTAPRPVTALRAEGVPYTGTAVHPTTVATGPKVPPEKRVTRIDDKTSTDDFRAKASAGTLSVAASCDRNTSTTSPPSSSTQSEETSSVISVTSANTSDLKDKKKTKKPYKVKVTYETKEVNIYPRQPILMVERLQNLEYHVGELTEALGRRPAVYPLGRRVRFVPETATEGATIQRYLARIEAQERIAWCSYSLPPGNSLKVTVKVKVVERIKITDDLAKLKLQEQSDRPAQEKQKDFDTKDVTEATSKQNGKIDKVSASKEKHISTSCNLNKDITEQPKNNANVNKKSTSSSGKFDAKAIEKQQVAASNKLGLTAPLQSTKTSANINNTNKSAIKPGRRQKHRQEPKKTTEPEKTAATEKTVPERDNKLRIVGVFNSSKLMF